MQLFFAIFETLFVSSEITLVDHDKIKNDIVGRQTLNLNGLEIDRVYQKTLVFGKVWLELSSHYVYSS